MVRIQSASVFISKFLLGPVVFSVIEQHLQVDVEQLVTEGGRHTHTLIKREGMDMDNNRHMQSKTSVHKETRLLLTTSTNDTKLKC